MRSNEDLSRYSHLNKIMKLALLNLLYCTTHAFRECVVKAKNIPDCQTICDTSSQCEAWVFKVFYFFKKKKEVNLLISHLMETAT